MSETSPYKLFFDWCFDGFKDTPIPKPEILLKYNSPINETFMIRMFIQNGKLNNYLDKHFNNIGLRYIDKEDLFYFIKECVRNFKIKRSDIHYFPWRPRVALFEKLRKKIPLLKDHEISLLGSFVEKSEDKDKIFSALGIDKPKKKKARKKKQKKKVGKISVEEFLNQNFRVV